MPEFNTIEDMPIVDPNQQGRIKQRDLISQYTNIGGQNKTIISSDGTNARVLIGYQKNGF